MKSCDIGGRDVDIGHSLSRAYVDPNDRKPLRRDETCQEGELLAFRVVRTDDVDAPQVSSLAALCDPLLRLGADPSVANF
jgi:hypothetical protein